MTQPFRARWDWKWPGALDVAQHGSMVVVASAKRGRHPPDLRALTVLEAAETEPDVLELALPIDRLRITLGPRWRKEAARVVRRVGLFPEALRSRIEIEHGGALLPIADAFGGALDAKLGNGADGEVVVAGDGVELLSDALDEWIGEVDRRLGEEDEPLVLLPKLRLVPENGRIHPRIEWLVRQLRARGLSIECPTRSVETGFIKRLTDAVVAHKEKSLKIAECGTVRGQPWAHVLPAEHQSAGVWAPLRLSIDWRLGDRLHQAFNNLKSSQAFAFNVLEGLHHIGLLGAALEKALGYAAGSIQSASLWFEFCPRELKKALGEGGAHQTQVDALVRLGLEGGRIEAVLFEVKLTEPEFGRCRGPAEEDNLRRDVCAGNASERLDACYLTGLGRTYLRHLDLLEPLADQLGKTSCPLRDDGYQLARNLLVARWLEGKLGEVPSKYEVDRARFVVLSAVDTPALASASMKRVAPGGGAAALAKLGVEWVDARALVLGVAGRPFTDYLADRYGPVFGRREPEQARPDGP